MNACGLIFEIRESLASVVVVVGERSRTGVGEFGSGSVCANAEHANAKQRNKPAVLETML
jgi:hypothetical protein